MCGIIGILLKKNVKASKKTDSLGKMLTRGLHTLEYRGYDSVGICILDNNGSLVLRKGKGTISNVSRKLSFNTLDGLIGIGHTRWATHGPPNDINAHPHFDCKEKIAIIHNGIIKNYLTLKKELKNTHVFRSETDTEVIVHLIEEKYEETKDFYKAFKESVRRLEGSYALVVVTLHDKEKLFFAKKESPLIIGVGRNGNYVASDIPALLEHTNKIIPLNDNEIGWISPNSVFIENMATGEIEEPSKRIITVNWKPEMARKGGYPHYMIKEIHEQPIALKSTFDGLVSDDRIVLAANKISEAKRIFISAAGTSYHAGLMTKFFIEKYARQPVYAFISSEYKHHSTFVQEGDVLLVISQSGETIDTLKALRAFKDGGATVISITNVLGSAIDRESDLSIPTRAGPEIGVAATKTFTTQILTGIYLAAHIGYQRGNINATELKEISSQLSQAGSVTGKSIVKSEGIIRELSETISQKNNAYFLGRGIGVPLAMEAALKLKEIAYIHAEAYPAGESKHGPIAIVEKAFPVFFMVTSDSIEEISGNIAEMNAREAHTIALTTQLDPGIEKAQTIIYLPPTTQILEPFVLTPPFQLLAYYSAVRLGYDPDKPRNLAKTVTVE